NRFNIVDIRGNIETRLKRLNDGDYDALILAEAGLVRLGYADVIRSLLEPPEFLPAVAQGAIGIEIREDDTATADVIAAINDEPTFAAITAERAFLRKLQGGCLAPIAAIGNVDDAGKLRLCGRILTVDGGQMLEGDLVGETENADGLGIGLAEILLERGADEIVKEIRGEFNKH
ncbi:MAG: hydroxymethylbilane synthase, partial [Planctomycetaceae bacterium]|nr:hydroxymethylbilane synthase [Planctomycetaceae bacterium]